MVVSALILGTAKLPAFASSPTPIPARHPPARAISAVVTLPLEQKGSYLIPTLTQLQRYDLVWYFQQANHFFYSVSLALSRASNSNFSDIKNPTWRKLVNTTDFFSHFLVQF